ncbi:hypothetical protein PDJAM_G00090680 [Pangasius djambal]|uniref:Uncharacterized protein n=1 Tax=Pangasius djambal TaxID=1691987 RepID=A0ACC5Z559_9TELE|nr:hypothetical protein [Pangasius djambal]
MADEASVITVICANLGCVEYDDLLQMAAVEDLENVIKNRDMFTVIQQNKSKKILATTNIRRCRARECQESCSDLHLCKFDLLGQCNTQRCKYGHSLESEHNSRLLREHNLQDLSKDQLRVLLLQNDNSLLPNVCVSYNKGSGEFGSCPDKEACIRLHVCEKYIRGLCDGSSECNRCHDFYEPHPMKTLQARGVASQLIGSLLLVYRNILTLKYHRNAQNKPGARSKENPKSSNRTRVPESLQGNAVNVICLSFIRGNCKYGDKCWRVHFGVPYKWEVEVDEVWVDLPDNEVTERNYCDPAKIHSVGSEPVCFDTMMQGVHRVRRLSTVSSVIEPSFSHTTKWIWYWEDEYNNWIEYGSIKKMHRLSSITCEELEQKYLQFLQDNTHDVLKFTAGKQFYELNFRDMKQRNEISSTERAIRRRPLFVSLFDVRTARTSRRGPTSSSHTGVPGFWDKTAIPESGFQRVLLNASHKDYIRVQEHFSKTMKDFRILTIERVQNKELWEDFQTKRERMKKANSHKKYCEAERLLFHGTNVRNVDAICRQNFDMRVSGANATVYGQGSYFARDAKYSHDYTDHYAERSMFACRVLVGQYTKGESHYRRPPARDAAGNLYDTCVNNVREPTIYVVFERSQVYPEFLIRYEKSRFPEDINIIQSNRTANVSKCSAIFDDALDVSQTTSVISTSSPQKANNIASGSTSTGETLASASIPTMRNPLSAALDAPVTPAKYVSSDSETDDTKSLNVVLAAAKSELPVHSQPTQGLTSLSRLPKESDQGFGTSVTNPVFSNSDNPLIAVKSSLTDNSLQSGIAKNQQETSLPVCISPSDGSLSGSLVSFYETHSSENASQRFDVFDDVCNVSQAASVISASSPHKAKITTSGSSSTGEEFLPSKPAQGLTSLSYAGLPRKSAQDLPTSVKIPVSSHSDNQLPSLTDRSVHSNLRPNPDLVTTQRSQRSQQDSPSAHREVVTNLSHPLLTIPSSTVRARTLSSDASPASSHSSKESKIPVMYKTNSSSADKLSLSDGSVPSSLVSFHEILPSAHSSTQTSPKSTSSQRASHQKISLETKKKNCVVQ